MDIGDSTWRRRLQNECWNNDDDNGVGAASRNLGPGLKFADRWARLFTTSYENP